MDGDGRVIQPTEIDWFSYAFLASWIRDSIASIA